MNVNIENKDLYFTRLGFEITRKCNMNCIHCCKGDSKNETITKEVIDRTLDSMKDNNIGTLHIFGGEPTLELDMIEYIIDGVIKRNMYILECLMTTNGRIKDIRIFEMFDKLGNFLNNNMQANKERQKIESYAKSKGSNCDNFGIPCTIYISDEDHVNIQKAIDTYDFLKKYENQNVCFLWQADDRKEEKGKENLYVYMGKAEDNYDILKDKLNYRIKVNKYSLRKSGSRVVEAPIYVCTNGNIVSSCMLDYDKEDMKENIVCNILTDDLFDSMNEWNFKNPLTPKQKKMKEKFLSEIFNYEHGVKRIFKKINQEDVLTDKRIDYDRKYLDAINAIEKFKIEVHKKYPYLTYDEFQFCSDSMLELRTEGAYLQTNFSGYEQSDTYVFNEDEMKEVVIGWIEINNQRKSERKLDILNTIFDKFLENIKR